MAAYRLEAERHVCGAKQQNSNISPILNGTIQITIWEIIMKIRLLSILVAVTFAFISNSIFADSIVATFTCKLKEGKKKEDVQAVNSKWLKYVNENVSKDITSSFGSAVIGNQDIFMFADSYPDLDIWAKTQTALDSEAASELGGMFEAVSHCSENRLWKLEPTK